jgi:hypothetical protein
MYLLRFLRVVLLRSAVAVVVSDFLGNLADFAIATLDHAWRSRHASSLQRFREMAQQLARPFVWDRGVLSFLFLFGSYSFDSYSAFAVPAFSSLFANAVER